MREQMEAVLAMDPVSGNEVPPGALPEEVRDDIDARLSEGEYIVPADVVRYFGVKFFEELRDVAKGGLQQMDSEGRIGGDEAAMEVPMYEEGGDVVVPKAPTFNPYSHGLGFSVYGPNTGATGPAPALEGMPMEYYNPQTDVTIIIMHDEATGMPLQAIPEGYYMVPPSEDEEVEEVMEPVSPRNPTVMSEEEKLQRRNSWMESYDYTDMDVLAKQTMDTLNKERSLLGSIFGGGVLAKFMAGSTLAQSNAHIELLEDQGYDVSELKAAAAGTAGDARVGACAPLLW